jgi:tripartite-type tricarboxylate transporter receptor subunit TctC
MILIYPRRNLKVLLLPMLIGAFAVLATPLIKAQTYPSHPIILVVSAPPGGGTDVSARTLAQRLGEKLGQPVVVENKPGANANIGAAQVARAKADGYTLLYTAQSPITIADQLEPKITYDPVNDLLPVVLTQITPVIVVAPTSLGVKNLAELVAYTKQNPNKTFYGSPGIGNELHLDAELVRQALNIDTKHVPYRGSGPALLDLIAGRTQFMVASPSSVKGHISEGRLVILATLSKDRLPSHPNVPTAIESGYPQLTTEAWFGIFAPAKTLPTVSALIRKAVMEVNNDQAYQKQVSDLGMRPVAMPEDEFRDLIKDYRRTWRRLIDSGAISASENLMPAPAAQPSR